MTVNRRHDDDETTTPRREPRGVGVSQDVQGPRGGESYDGLRIHEPKTVRTANATPPTAASWRVRLTHLIYDRRQGMMITALDGAART